MIPLYCKHFYGSLQHTMVNIYMANTLSMGIHFYGTPTFQSTGHRYTLHNINILLCIIFAECKWLLQGLTFLWHVNIIYSINKQFCGIY